MDQCEDCSEVVCGNCSTLMSCKFCGCGLCEDCATACGRCGIVLCSKDAKFAVECDTCKMSYCLVCLASGTKDPCVRCAHRPSKRVEQLVHLRLKSIYKAFKQSGAALGGAPGGPGSGPGGHRGIGPAAGARGLLGEGGSSSRAAAAAAIARAAGLPSGDSSIDAALEALGGETGHGGAPDLGLAGGVGAVLQAAAAAAAASGAGGAAGRGGTSRRTPHAGGSGSGTNAGSKRGGGVASAGSRTQAEADAAAAALLAELDLEEANRRAVEERNKGAASKKKKKKKKGGGGSGGQQQQQPPDETNVTGNNVKKPPDPDGVADVAPSSALSNDKKRLKDAKEKGDNLKNTDGSAVAKYLTDEDENREDHYDNDDDQFDHPDDEILKLTVNSANTDPKLPMPTDGHNHIGNDIEDELAKLVELSDADGIERLLGSIRGVPGRAALRKNAKKALKRIKEEIAAAFAAADMAAQEQREREAAMIQANQPPIPIPSAGTERQQPSLSRGSAPRPHPHVPPSRDEVLLRLVSHTQRPNGDGTGGGPPSRNGRSESGGSAPSGGPSARCECVMHMSPTVVGWVIGKGGTRIRDLMDSSGAKIWIDQDSMGPSDPRVMYVSGQRRAVDVAVRMIQELVAKAPVIGQQAQHAQQQAQQQAQQRVATPPPPSRGPTPEEDAERAEAADFVAAASAAAAANTEGKSRVSTVGQTVWKENGQCIEYLHCEAQFVALLIGRRGWTVKHIQDVSGARVDIDQSCTPRKITISGSVAAVRGAVRMVRDVLSYPNAQLHYPRDGEGGVVDPVEGSGPVPPADFAEAVTGPVTAAAHGPDPRSGPIRPDMQGLSADGHAPRALLRDASLPRAAPVPPPTFCQMVAPVSRSAAPVPPSSRLSGVLPVLRGLSLDQAEGRQPASVAGLHCAPLGSEQTSGIGSGGPAGGGSFHHPHVQMARSSSQGGGHGMHAASLPPYRSSLHHLQPCDTNAVGGDIVAPSPWSNQGLLDGGVGDLNSYFSSLLPSWEDGTGKRTPPAPGMDGTVTAPPPGMMDRSGTIAPGLSRHIGPAGGGSMDLLSDAQGFAGGAGMGFAGWGNSFPGWDNGGSMGIGGDGAAVSGRGEQLMGLDGLQSHVPHQHTMSGGGLEGLVGMNGSTHGSSNNVDNVVHGDFSKLPAHLWNDDILNENRPEVSQGRMNDLGSAKDKAGTQMNSSKEDSLEIFLSSVNLKKYGSMFVEHEIDWAALQLMGEGDLAEIGLPKGPRLKIIKGLRGSS